MGAHFDNLPTGRRDPASGPLPDGWAVLTVDGRLYLLRLSDSLLAALHPRDHAATLTATRWSVDGADRASAVSSLWPTHLLDLIPLAPVGVEGEVQRHPPLAAAPSGAQEGPW